MTRRLLLLAVFLTTGAPLFAAEWHVNNETGNNSGVGDKEHPFLSLQKAIASAADGDVIHLHPAGAVYRQAGSFRGKFGITIEGNGVTLDGAITLPNDGWEELGDGLYRRKLPRTRYDRHLLIIDGHAERMGRTASNSKTKAFPEPSQLQPGQFRFQTIDEKSGWLYVRGTPDKLEWATRVNGIATSGTCRRLVVRNLNTRHFLNDGFNIHGDARELHFENIEGYDCFDEGFSAHDTCECTINGGRFFGSEHGIADVNQAETIYRNCVFTDNVNVDALLIGKAHSLIDCQIVNTTSAAALIAGPRTKGMPFTLRLERVAIATDKPSGQAAIRIDGGSLTFGACTFDNVVMDLKNTTPTPGM
ncbi:hypothetical protein [Planctomycetes bacterium Pan216]